MGIYIYFCASTEINVYTHEPESSRKPLAVYGMQDAAIKYIYLTVRRELIALES